MTLDVKYDSSKGIIFMQPLSIEKLPAITLEERFELADCEVWSRFKTKSTKYARLTNRVAHEIERKGLI